MTRLPVLPTELAPDRDVLHRVATHVLARRRADCTGRFGLRVTPGGFGTPAFGDDEVVRVAAGRVVRERRIDGELRTTSRPIGGSTLAELAALVDVDLSVDFQPGRDAPPVGDVDEPLALTARGLDLVVSWFAVTAEALDGVLGALGDAGSPSVAQLWPEHFDLAVDVAAGSTRVNLGASPGDASIDEPYVYVGPWSAERPGDEHYWNTSFGAAATYRELFSASDATTRVASFWTRGLVLLGATG